MDAALRCVAKEKGVVSRRFVLKVEIWSDVVCPWCYIGKRRFEAALERFPHRDEVEVEWKAFELDPTSTSGTRSEAGSHAKHISTKYRINLAEAQGMLDNVTANAAAEGLDVHFEKAVGANTFEAHQLIHLGGVHGVQDAVKERLMRAYFIEGEAVGDRETLIRLAEEAGLEPAEVRSALDSEQYAAAVRREENEARELGITGVPFFVIERKYGVSGAQPADALLGVLEQVWAEDHPAPKLTPVGGGDGQVCGPDGCPV
jgi:predicted DsbA family dithiol-disulfide isomerase